MKSTLAIVALSLFITGCTTVPVVPKFPVPPAELMAPCDDLRKIENTSQVAITELLKVVVENYGTHYECAIKVNAWTEWYEQQSQIYNKIK